MAIILAKKQPNWAIFEIATTFCHLDHNDLNVGDFCLNYLATLLTVFNLSPVSAAPYGGPMFCFAYIPTY